MRPPIGQPPVPAASADPSPTPTMPLPPPPSTDFTGSGAFATTWDRVAFRPAACPTGHPLASCFAGTASGKLPIAGEVLLARSMIVGDGPSPAPSGCVTATTDGTVASAAGGFSFHADGRLCGRVSTFVITSSVGSGTLASFRVWGVIVNDAVTETWTGEVVPVG